MTGSLFLVAVSYPNFGRTVADAVRLSEYDPPPEVTREFPSDRPVRIWGTRKGGGNRRQYADLEPDDSLLFFRDGSYVAAGRVGKKFDTPWVSRMFWGYAPMELLYSVEAFREVDVSPGRLNDAIGLDADYAPEGIRGVDDDLVAAACEGYDSIDAFVDALDGGED